MGSTRYMKTVCIFLALSVAVISAVPITEDVQQQYINGDPKDLLKPLDDIIADIKEEEKEDQQQVDEDTAKVVVKEEKEAKDRMDTAETNMQAAHKSLDTQQTSENKREQEYAKNNEVRAKELAGLTKVEKEVKKVVDEGPADGTMGVLAKSKVITLLQQMESHFHRSVYGNTIDDIQRKGAEATSMFSDVTKAREAIDKEDKQDQAEVKVEQKKTRALRVTYDEKKGAYETSVNYHNESVQRREISETALEDTKKDKAAAD